MEVSKDTKNRLLDVAEQLFAEHGADKTTLRQVCALAGVNVAAVNYHFGSKAEMINALLSRIMGRVVEVQIALLHNEVQNADNGPKRLENVIRAFLAPIFATAREHPNLRELFDNLSRACGDITYFRDHINKLLQQVHRQYVKAFSSMLPELTQAQILHRYAFLWASTHDIVDHWLREDLQVTFAADADLSDTRLEEMVCFMAGGFRATCNDTTLS